ncbi:MAG: SH3 domain-containing protein [Clostridia bacterium]|nr:SH3 domain-containing protein [Clostridia bacterium]
MKKALFRRVFPLLFCFLLALPASAFAMKDDGVYMVNGKWTDAYWYTTSCYHATTQPVTVYADKDMTQVKTVIPAKTFLRKQSNLSVLEWDESGSPVRVSSYVEYILYPSGVRGDGWIDNNDNYTSVESAITSGGWHLLDLMIQNDLMLNPYNASSDPYQKNDPVWGDLSGYKGSDFPYWQDKGTRARSAAKSAAETGAQDKGAGSESTSSAPSAKSAQTSSAALAAAPSRFTVEWEDGKAYVELVTLGCVTSRVKSLGTVYEVDTADLYLDGEPVLGRVAGIFAPNTGECSLRATASDSGKLLKKAKAGRLVIALEKKGNYTKILYGDQEGWVLTTCLKFYDADAQPLGAATLVYSQDKPNVRTTVNIRGKASKDGAKIAEWDTGTLLTVWSQSGGWCEVEYNGLRGWVMEQFISPEE